MRFSRFPTRILLAALLALFLTLPAWSQSGPSFYLNQGAKIINVPKGIQLNDPNNQPANNANLLNLLTQNGEIKIPDAVDGILDFPVSNKVAKKYLRPMAGERLWLLEDGHLKGAYKTTKLQALTDGGSDELEVYFRVEPEKPDDDTSMNPAYKLFISVPKGTSKAKQPKETQAKLVPKGEIAKFKKAFEKSDEFAFKFKIAEVNTSLDFRRKGVQLFEFTIGTSPLSRDPDYKKIYVACGLGKKLILLDAGEGNPSTGAHIEQTFRMLDSDYVVISHTLDGGGMALCVYKVEKGKIKLVYQGYYGGDSC